MAPVFPNICLNENIPGLYKPFLKMDFVPNSMKKLVLSLILNPLLWNKTDVVEEE